MKLPVISELKIKNDRKNAVDEIVRYLKELVNVIQREFDKKQAIKNEVYVVDVIVSSARTVVKYSDGTEKVFNTEV